MRSLALCLALFTTWISSAPVFGQQERTTDELVRDYAVTEAKIAILSAIKAGGRNSRHLYMNAINTVFTPSTNPCRLEFLLYNNSVATLDALLLTMTIHGRDGAKLATKEVLFRYVDSGTFDLANTEGPAECRMIRTIRLRDVPVCKLGGEQYRDCLDQFPTELGYPWVDQFGK